jgi:hypothetical protein
MSKILLSFTYQELYTIKHALQMYVSRDKPKKDTDISREIDLLNCVSGKIRTFEQWARIPKKIESEE